MSSVNKRKCILSICDISPMKMGSFEEFLISLTKKLIAEGLDHVIVFRSYPIPQVEKALIDVGAKIVVTKPSKVKALNFFIFYRLLKKIQPTIVHFHFYPVYTAINYLKYFFNINLLYTDHMGGRKTKTVHKKILRRIYYYLNYFLYNGGIDTIICVSNFVKSKYEIEYGVNSKKLYLIYNGVNTVKFNKSDKQMLKSKYKLKNEYIISCIGLRRDKGPHYLMEAAPLILKEICDVKFIFAGEGDCRDYLQSLAEDLNINENVLFIGKVEDLSELYNMSSIIAIPSTFEEAFCFVAAEAMATGTPVVAFDSGAIREVLYDSNLIIPKSPDLLAMKIVECLKINVDTRVLRVRVQEHFSLQKCVTEHFSLYSTYLYA